MGHLSSSVSPPPQHVEGHEQGGELVIAELSGALCVLLTQSIEKGRHFMQMVTNVQAMVCFPE